MESWIAEKVKGEDRTYSIAGGVLLFRANHGAAAGRLVQRCLAPDDGLALGGTGARDARADFSDGVPVVRHLVGGVRWKNEGGSGRLVDCFVG